MTDKSGKPAPPTYVVLREVSEGVWHLLAEVRKRPGLSAEAARTRAILDATRGAARAGEVYAAVPRSEWRVSQRWTAPDR